MSSRQPKHFIAIYSPFEKRFEIKRSHRSFESEAAKGELGDEPPAAGGG